MLPLGVSVSPLTQMAAGTGVFGYSVVVSPAVSCCQLMVEVTTTAEECFFNVWGLVRLAVSSLSLPCEPCFLDNQVQASRPTDRNHFLFYFLYLCATTLNGYDVE